MAARTPAGQRLAERSERRGACLVYTAGQDRRSGHAVMSFQGAKVHVHRIAYILSHGPIPPGLVVRHSCDVPRCIEPAHLLLGTNVDNVDDRCRRGRSAQPKGSKNGAARLTEGQVELILAALGQGQTQRSLAAQYGVTQSAIALISTGKTWTHVARPVRNAA